MKAGGAGEVEATKESEFEVVMGVTPEADAVFIINLPKPDVSEQAIRELKKKMREEGLRGLMTTATVNGGYTLAGAIGGEGVKARLPSMASEALAKVCATWKPR